ncbi:MAG: phosphatase PAP2 family protein [Prevotella sp.]|nr:phosphatase PAP2 family protein [Prevotella sp.]
MPKFDYKLDNYTQIAPAAVMLGLKAAGVPSRSSWGRMIMSDAITITLMTGVVQGLKYTTNVTRPDGSNKQSFPSGHTATAFMTATMLSKEYGHISPWVSVGAYTIATATGLMRMANNKHWLSDVMVGAGFGILSTEFGYWITDAFMKGRGLNFQKLQEEEQLGRSNPSFFNLYMGFNVPLSKFDINNNTTFQTSVGTVLGVEGAYFFNQYIGIGGRSTFSNIQLIINDTEAQDNTFNFDNFSIGPYFSLPLTLRWTLDTKLLATFTYYYNTIINNINIPKNTGWGIGTGLGINYHIRKHFAFGLFADHNIQPPYSIKSKEYIHTLTIGTKAAMRF